MKYALTLLIGPHVPRRCSLRPKPAPYSQSARLPPWPWDPPAPRAACPVSSWKRSAMHRVQYRPRPQAQQVRHQSRGAHQGALRRHRQRGARPHSSGMQAAMQEFSEQHAAEIQADMAQQTSVNLKASTDFLEANKARPGVVTLPSGLQYEIVAEGAGAMPKADDTVVVDYKGTLVNGEQFDSSYDRGEPAKFTVGGVIPGWSEALQVMKIGSKWKLYIPPSLAYGDKGAGPIGPNQALIFEVELKEIKAPELENAVPSVEAPATEAPAAK